jgi:GAF domain-containing protein
MAFKIRQSECVSENYRLLYDNIKNFLAGESDLIAGLANTASFLYWTLPGVNWAGFYLLKGKELVLGPFAGKPACVRIAVGKGVCGTCAALGKIIKVDNVHEFEGHIACDCDSNSEIVLPLFRRGEIFGVLDVDSPVLNRFTDADKEGLDGIVGLINNFLDRC